jgi:type II secretory pathway component GspD/PulD (secretin)
LDARNADHLASILLEARLVEVPDETLAKLVSEFNLGGLNKLKAEGKASSAQSLFTADDAALILKTLEQSAGVDVLSTPRVQTSEGVQAILTTGQQKIVEGVEHVLGPTLDVEPRLAADGSSVNLTVSARFKKLGSIPQNTPP